VAALRAHGKRVLSDLLAADPGRPVTDLLLQVGRSLPRRQDSRGYLVVEALIAARRDEEVAGPMREYIGERAGWLAGLVQAGQAEARSIPRCRPARWRISACCSRLGARCCLRTCTPSNDAEWAALLIRVVERAGPGAGGRSAVKPRGIARRGLGTAVVPGERTGGCRMTEPRAPRPCSVRARGR